MASYIVKLNWLTSFQYSYRWMEKIWSILRTRAWFYWRQAQCFFQYMNTYILKFSPQQTSSYKNYQSACEGWSFFYLLVNLQQFKAETFLCQRGQGIRDFCFLPSSLVKNHPLSLGTALYIWLWACDLDRILSICHPKFSDFR